MTVGVVVDDDAISDLFALLNRAVGQVELKRVRAPIHSHPHGFVLSKRP
jgi:hypothetical protein